MKADAIADSDTSGRAPHSLARQLRDIDARRPDFPGEHLIVFSPVSYTHLTLPTKA